MLKRFLIVVVGLLTLVGGTTTVSQPVMAKTTHHAKKRVAKRKPTKRRKVVRKRTKKATKKRVVKRRAAKKAVKRRVVKKVVKKRVAKKVVKKSGPTDGQKKALKIAENLLSDMNYPSTYNDNIKSQIYVDLTGSGFSTYNYSFSKNEAKYAIAHINWNKFYAKFANYLTRENYYSKKQLYSELAADYHYSDKDATYAASQISESEWNEMAWRKGMESSWYDKSGTEAEYKGEIYDELVNDNGFTASQANYALAHMNFIND